MDTRSEIIFDLDMSKEEQDMWRTATRTCEQPAP